MTPFFCRVLQGVLDVETWAEHLRAIEGESATEAQGPPISVSTSVRELLDWLASTLLERGYKSIVAKTNVPAIGLAEFFQNLIEVYGYRVENFALVIILDQFEELFTRFVDLGPQATDGDVGGAAAVTADAPDWRLRWRFFDELRSLYEAQVPLRDAAEQPTGRTALLPIRYVISMREDYTAHLDPLRSFVSNLQESSYRLQMLDKAEAAKAIQQPAAQYGYTHADDLFKAILAELTREDRYVEPAHLQMVCDKLWEVSGRELSQCGEAEGHDLAEVKLEVLRNLKGTRGIFESVLTDFLNDLSSDHRRREAIEILEPLITGNRTRNIVERESLLAVPFVDLTVRREVFAALETARIVRVESRLGGYFVEITHEFLIAPILKAIREAQRDDPRYARRRSALGTLERLERAVLTGRCTDLMADFEFEVLHESREDVAWPTWAVEVMLRSAIAVGAPPTALLYWSRRFEDECSVPATETLIGRLPQLIEIGARLNKDEIGQFTATGPGIHLSDADIEFVLRSVLAVARDDEGELVRHWIERHRHDNA